MVESLKQICRGLWERNLHLARVCRIRKYCIIHCENNLAKEIREIGRDSKHTKQSIFSQLFVRRARHRAIWFIAPKFNPYGIFSPDKWFRKASLHGTVLFPTFCTAAWIIHDLSRIRARASNFLYSTLPCL